MEKLRAYFDQLYPLSDEEWIAFATKLVPKEVKKKEWILLEGESCNYIAFIEQGVFRFYHTKDGQEIVTAFFFVGDFLSNYRSFLSNQASKHSIQALKKSKIWMMQQQDLYQLYEQYPMIDRLGRLVAEQLYLTVARRLDIFMYETPEERYLDLIRRGSKLLHEVPQYMLASYLGVSPETLSRIRKRIF